VKVPGSIPKKRQELLHWNGWGYKDSGFVLVTKGTKRNPSYGFTFSGSRYEIANTELPHFFEWVNARMGISPDTKKDSQPPPLNYPEPIINQGNLDT